MRGLLAVLTAVGLFAAMPRSGTKAAPLATGCIDPTTVACLNTNQAFGQIVSSPYSDALDAVNAANWVYRDAVGTPGYHAIEISQVYRGSAQRMLNGDVNTLRSQGFFRDAAMPETRLIDLSRDFAPGADGCSPVDVYVHTLEHWVSTVRTSSGAYVSSSDAWWDNRYVVAQARDQFGNCVFMVFADDETPL